MKYGNYSNVFGVEKEYGKLNGILSAIYQYVFGTELYPSIEEKAANLLYFLIKDHPFVDGGKRIGASIFLEFLNWITMAWMRSILQKNNIEYNKSPDNWVTCLMYMKCFLEIYAI